MKLRRDEDFKNPPSGEKDIETLFYLKGEEGVYWRLKKLVSGGRAVLLLLEVVREDDRFGQVAHGAAEAAALVAEAEIRFGFRQVVLVLENALGAFDQLAHFERPLHLQC